MKKIFTILISVVLLLSFSTMTYAGSASDLKYSTYLSTPSNYNSVNCYGYAIGLNVAVDPGYFSNNTYNESVTSSQFKNLVISDLTALGYTVRTTTNVNASLSSDEIMIAYYYGGWSGTVGNSEFEERAYHFWIKSSNSGAWNHKFGKKSGLMRFNYSPYSSNIAKVSNEYYNGITGEYQSAKLFADTSTLGGSWGYIIFNYYDLTALSESEELVALAANVTEENDNSIAAIYERYIQSLERGNNK